jgi:plasmid stabilization system protein ParE
VLDYLEQEWSQQVAADFLRKIDHWLRQLAGQPFTGATAEKIKDVGGVLINRLNRFYYKVRGKKVLVLNMYDTRMNPKKKKY